MKEVQAMLNGAFVLAAGTSSRMESRTSKLLQKVAGRPMILWVKEALKQAGASEQVYVVGYQQAEIRKTVGENMIYMLQERPLGTGHATAKAASFLEGVDGAILVCPADIPLIRPQTLVKLVRRFEETKCACAFLTAHIAKELNLTYEEVCRDSNGEVCDLKSAPKFNQSVDFFTESGGFFSRSRNLTPRMRNDLVEVSSGIYCFDTSLLLSALGKIGAKLGNDRPYELSDIIKLLLADGQKVETVEAYSLEVLGVKTRAELDDVIYIMNQRICDYHMLRGVTIVDPDTCQIDYDVRIGADTVVGPNVVLLDGCQISTNCEIGPFSTLKSAIIGANTKVERAVLTECKLGQDNRIGAFTEIRQSVLGDDCQVDSFSLVQNSELQAQNLVNDHVSLTYIKSEKMQEYKSGTVLRNHLSQKQEERREKENIRNKQK
ncbi:putative UDP-N-acetylglucosamine diphosphorylase/glucosamine-1-phosphate N-acetyltransferase [Amygdalobacter nucleatus]|uniref:Putative UDP-N-acetylglucosamine diphosphorylase/glucosamine-1-phosphate N-acetyltransferase n=2 Tax=Amygdalobacter nucleatus TaxID=3029274 RepID=A0A133YHL9_9FIRM|nr:putative UDP-N-acetylglucosamine diphosphorylase/glucosamine-1-phosphate N-acetyltransferase [Amygdalobacter nucleatus]